MFLFLAGWVWGEHGFLNNLGAVDIAGSGPVSSNTHKPSQHLKFN